MAFRLQINIACIDHDWVEFAERGEISDVLTSAGVEASGDRVRGYGFADGARFCCVCPNGFWAKLSAPASSHCLRLRDGVHTRSRGSLGCHQTRRAVRPAG